MSKRASRNATIFAGVNWGVGPVKKIKKQKHIKNLADKQFEELCQKFGINAASNEFIYSYLEAEFKAEFTAYKTAKRNEIIEKVSAYKKHCKRKNIKPSIHDYLANNLYNKTFVIKTTNKSRKSNKSKNNPRSLNQGAKLSNFLPNETIVKLKNLNRK